MTVNSLAGISVNQQPTVTLGQRFNGAVAGLKDGYEIGSDLFLKDGELAWKTTVYTMGIEAALFTIKTQDMSLGLFFGGVFGAVTAPFVAPVLNSTVCAIDGFIHPAKYLK